MFRLILFVGGKIIWEQNSFQHQSFSPIMIQKSSVLPFFEPFVALDLWREVVADDTQKKYLKDKG